MDRQGRYFSLGWGLYWERMVHDKPVYFAWRFFLLASLYRDLHEYVYLGGRALGAGVKLLHV